MEISPIIGVRSPSSRGFHIHGAHKFLCICRHHWRDRYFVSGYENEWIPCWGFCVPNIYTTILTPAEWESVGIETRSDSDAFIYFHALIFSSSARRKAERKSPGANKLCFCVFALDLFVSAVRCETQIEKPTSTLFAQRCKLCFQYAGKRSSY